MDEQRIRDAIDYCVISCLWTADPQKHLDQLLAQLQSHDDWLAVDVQQVRLQTEKEIELYLRVTRERRAADEERHKPDERMALESLWHLRREKRTWLLGGVVLALSNPLV
jgi:hypothetical protein